MPPHVTALDADRHPPVGASTAATGSIPYISATDAITWLAAGTSGDVLTSNGAGSAPSYQTPAAANDLDGAYEAGRIVNIDTSAPIALRPSTLGHTGELLLFEYGVGNAYTGTPHAIKIDWSTSTLNTANPVFGIQLLGETNAEASNDSIGIDIDSAWDVPLRIASSALTVAALTITTGYIAFPTSNVILGGGTHTNLNATDNVIIGHNTTLDGSGDTQAVIIGSEADSSLQGFAGGYNANAGARSVSIGANSLAATDAVSVGSSAGAVGSGSGAAAFGVGANAIGTEGIAIGSSARAASGHNRSIAIGGLATTTASQQFVSGAAGARRITEVVFGYGAADSNEAMSAVVYRGTNAITGTDLAGQSIDIKAGGSTGDGGSELGFFIALSSQGAGTTQRASVEVVNIATTAITFGVNGNPNFVFNGTGNLDFNGTAVDLDPIGAFTLDMLASFDATITLSATSEFIVAGTGIFNYDAGAWDIDPTANSNVVFTISGNAAFNVEMSASQTSGCAFSDGSIAMLDFDTDADRIHMSTVSVADGRSTKQTGRAVTTDAATLQTLMALTPPKDWGGGAIVYAFGNNITNGDSAVLVYSLRFYEDGTVISNVGASVISSHNAGTSALVAEVSTPSCLVRIKGTISETINWHAVVVWGGAAD